jgi:type II secretory pathway predicted ATPase ExeA
MRETATRLALGYITQTPLTEHELLEQLLGGYGFTPYKNSRTERLQLWGQYLAEMSATGTRVCIVVENADEMSPAVLARLDNLSAADASGATGANLILTSRSPLQGLQSDPALASLRQRVRLVATVAPLSADETANYLAFKLALAGSSLEAIFEPDATVVVHDLSGGVIRLIDNIVDSCLSIAATRNLPKLSAALIAEIGTDHFGISWVPDFSADLDGTGAHALQNPALATEAHAPDQGENKVAQAPENGNTANGSAEHHEVIHAARSTTTLEDRSSAAELTPPAPALALEATTPGTAVDTSASIETAGLGPNAPVAEHPALMSGALGNDLPVMTDVVVADVPVLTDFVEHSSAVSVEAILAGTTLPPAVVQGQAALAETVPNPARLPDVDELAFDLELLAAASSPVNSAARSETDTHSNNDDVGTLGSIVIDGDEDDIAAEDLQQIEMLEAFANAQALESISNSMAETLFGESELKHLAGLLALETGESGNTAASPDNSRETGDSEPANDVLRVSAPGSR